MPDDRPLLGVGWLVKFWSQPSGRKNMKEEISNSPQFQAVDLVKKEDEKDPERKKKIIEATENGFAFINGVEAKVPVWLKNTTLERKK